MGWFGTAVCGAERASPERGVDQGESQNDQTENEKPVAIDPGQHHNRQQPRQPRILVPAKQDRQFDREIE